MGRLHVSQTGAQPTSAEMELRQGGEYRWNSWAGRGAFLPTVAFAVHRSPFTVQTVHRVQESRVFVSERSSKPKGLAYHAFGVRR
jgi:hypothetical protein